MKLNPGQDAAKMCAADSGDFNSSWSIGLSVNEKYYCSMYNMIVVIYDEIIQQICAVLDYICILKSCHNMGYKILKFNTMM